MKEYDIIHTAKLSDLTPDDLNANKGTERGDYQLTQSLEKYGAGRSILIDKQGRIIAGNKTAAKFGELGLEDVVVVQTDGKQLVAVQRTDIDLDTPEGRELAIADNRTSELNLEWDSDALDAMASQGVDLDQFWKPEELDRLLGDVVEETDPQDLWEEEGMPEFNHDDLTSSHKIIVNFSTKEDFDLFQQKIGQKITDKTKSIWFPPQENIRYGLA